MGWASRPTSSQRRIGFVLQQPFAYPIHHNPFSAKHLPLWASGTNWLCFVRSAPGNADLLIGIVSGIGFVSHERLVPECKDRNNYVSRRDAGAQRIKELRSCLSLRLRVSARNTLPVRAKAVRCPLSSVHCSLRLSASLRGTLPIDNQPFAAHTGSADCMVQKPFMGVNRKSQQNVSVAYFLNPGPAGTNKRRPEMWVRRRGEGVPPLGAEAIPSPGSGQTLALLDHSPKPH